MDDGWKYADALGPAKIVHLHQPDLALRAVVVIDNVAAGPAVGGIRLAQDANTGEAVRLARAMTFKNAMARLPHGGGKSVILGDARMPRPDKERLVRAFAQAIRDLRDYVPGPDMGTDEVCMAWIRDEIGRAVGLPRELGGIPLDEIGATGWGLFNALQVAYAHLGHKLEGARVVVQGFGAVGSHVARFLAGAGAVLVGACDIGGSLHDPAGLDVPRLLALRKEGRPLADYPGGSHGERDAVIDMPCDIWIPAARPDVLNESNVHRLRTRVVAQGANIPCTEGAERALHARGILVLPDFVVNAGGVICGSVEYHGGNEADALELIRRRIQENTAQVLEMAAREGVPPRQAALTMARAHVERAMSFGRFAGADGRHAAEGWETHTQRSDPCTASGFTAAAARG